MLNSKNGVFYLYFSVGTCPMRKLLLWISRGLNLLSFSLKKNIIFFETFLRLFFMGNPSLTLSEVLAVVQFFSELSRYGIELHCDMK